MKWYYYLHTNGDVIGKNPFVVEADSQYFNSPFVVKFWFVNSRETLIDMLKDLWEHTETNLISNPKLTIKRILEIEQKNKITKADYE